MIHENSIVSSAWECGVSKFTPKAPHYPSENWRGKGLGARRPNTASMYSPSVDKQPAAEGPLGRKGQGLP